MERVLKIFIYYVAFLALFRGAHALFQWIDGTNIQADWVLYGFVAMAATKISLLEEKVGL